MCWRGSKSDLRIADKDIRVFKIVVIDGKEIKPYFNTCSSVLYGKVGLFGYKRNKRVVKTAMPFNLIYINHFSCYCEEALHSYSEDKTSLRFYQGTDIDFSILDEGGYSICGYSNFKTLIMHCVIPIGTRYAMNKRGEIVSDAIKVVSFEKIKR